MNRRARDQLSAVAFMRRNRFEMTRLFSAESPFCSRRNTCGVRRFSSAATVLPEEFRETLRSAMRSQAGGQVVFGSVVGFATGYSIKKIGQLLLVLIGLEVAALQWMSSRGWVDVKWKTISKELSPHVEKDAMNRVVEAVKLKMPFAGSFSAGCYAGLAWK